MSIQNSMNKLLEVEKSYKDDAARIELLLPAVISSFPLLSIRKGIEVEIVNPMRKRDFPAHSTFVKYEDLLLLYISKIHKALGLSEPVYMKDQIDDYIRILAKDAQVIISI